MGLVGLWAVAVLMIVSAVVFGWVTVSARPRATALEHRSRRVRQDEVVRVACADLDEEYRRLLQH